MRIVKVEAIPLKVPLEKEIAAPISLPHAEELASTVFREYRTTLVRVTADNGKTGVGECMVRLAPEATAAIVDAISPMLIGKDPRQTSRIWDLLYGAMMNRGHVKGFYIEALSGIDTALWDLNARSLGVPCHQLLGGKHREWLDAYASSLRFRPMAETRERIDRLVERGFRAFKIKIGRDRYDPTGDLRFVAQVREYVADDVRLMVDANCGYDRTSALTAGRALVDLDVYWFEEPLPPDDVDGYRYLSERLELRIASGESDFTRFGMRPFLEGRAWNVVQPNAGRAGGLTECMRIASLAETFGIAYAPHTGSSSAVSMAVAIQIGAAVPNFMIYEHMISDWNDEQPNPLRHELLTEPVEQLEQGRVRVPESPGLGFELDEDVLERCRAR